MSDLENIRRKYPKYAVEAFEKWKTKTGKEMSSEGKIAFLNCQIAMHKIHRQVKTGKLKLKGKVEIRGMHPY
ncbi:MAG: hypothetical protein ACUVTB_06790 [Candidatus Bathycorpusculaceae bacterium]